MRQCLGTDGQALFRRLIADNIEVDHVALFIYLAATTLILRISLTALLIWFKMSRTKTMCQCVDSFIRRNVSNNTCCYIGLRVSPRTTMMLI